MPEYFKYRKHGFRTRTGKFNLYCEGLRKLGYSPLPSYTAADDDARRYVLTSAHSRFYFNSEFRNVGSLRQREPDPTIEIHPETAARENISNGGWVLVSANGRSTRFRARITDGIAPGVVCVSSNWWYPELPFGESWQLSNVNLLTVNRDENEEMGSSNFRGISCRLEPLAESGFIREEHGGRAIPGALPDAGGANRQEESRHGEA